MEAARVLIGHPILSILWGRSYRVRDGDKAKQTGLDGKLGDPHRRSSLLFQTQSRGVKRADIDPVVAHQSPIADREATPGYARGKTFAPPRLTLSVHVRQRRS